MTLEQANRALAMAWGASAFFTMISLILPGAGIFDVLTSGGAVWAVVDLVVLGGLTIGVFKRSRICAVLLLGLFVATVIYQWHAVNWSASFARVVPLVFLVLFARGARGAFVFHRLSRERDDARQE